MADLTKTPPELRSSARFEEIRCSLRVTLTFFRDTSDRQYIFSRPFSDAVTLYEGATGPLSCASALGKSFSF